MVQERQAHYLCSTPAGQYTVCNRRGVYPQSIEVMGSTVHAWRNIPSFPCNKIPITDRLTSSILVLRTGEEDQGVVVMKPLSYRNPLFLVTR